MPNILELANFMLSSKHISKLMLTLAHWLGGDRLLDRSIIWNWETAFHAALDSVVPDTLWRWHKMFTLLNIPLIVHTIPYVLYSDRHVPLFKLIED